MIWIWRFTWNPPFWGALALHEQRLHRDGPQTYTFLNFPALIHSRQEKERKNLFRALPCFERSQIAEMMSSDPFPSSSSSSFLLEAPELSRSRGSSTICNSFQRSHSYIPKLEPFSRSKIERGVKEPSFIQKTENDLAGKNLVLLLLLRLDMRIWRFQDCLQGWFLLCVRDFCV